MTPGTQKEAAVTLAPADRLRNVMSMLKMIVEGTDCHKIEGLEGDLGFAILTLNEVLIAVMESPTLAVFDLRCRVAAMAEEQKKLNERLTNGCAHATLKTVFETVQRSSPLEALFILANKVLKEDSTHVATRQFVSEWRNREAQSGEL